MLGNRVNQLIAADLKFTSAIDVLESCPTSHCDLLLFRGLCVSVSGLTHARLQQ